MEGVQFPRSKDPAVRVSAGSGRTFSDSSKFFSGAKYLVTAVDRPIIAGRGPFRRCSRPDGPNRYGRMGTRPGTRADDHTAPKGQAMAGAITDSERSSMLRAAVSKVGRDELKQALNRSSGPDFQVPRPVANPLNALRKHRDPTEVVGKAPYRAALPTIAAAIAEPCLSRTIEVLGRQRRRSDEGPAHRGPGHHRSRVPAERHRRHVGLSGRQRDAGFRSLLRDRGHRRAVRPGRPVRDRCRSHPDPGGGEAGRGTHARTTPGPPVEEAEGRRGASAARWRRPASQ